MSDDDEDIEWEYEDESDAGAADASAATAENAGADTGEEFQYSDEDDVDWEDAGEPSTEPTPSQEMDDSTEDTVSDLNAVNWDHINSVLQREAEKENGVGKPKRKVVRMSKEDKARELALHKTHLLLSLATHQRINALCQSRVLRGLLLSLTSESKFDFFKDATRSPLRYVLELLVGWIHQHFSLPNAYNSERLATDEIVADAPAISENALLRVISSRVGSHVELAVLFTVLCRSIGLRTRMAMAMDPLTLQRRSNAAEAVATGSLASKAGRKRDRGSMSTIEPSQPTLWIWSEVFNAKTSAWMMADVVHKLVNQPLELEMARGKNFPFSYVVSADDAGVLTDVTPRYVERWSKTLPSRIAHDWLADTIEQLNNRFVAGDAAERALEGACLQQLAEQDAMPTSLAAFKKHHVYCLERDLKQTECIHPKKAIGLFKGFPVYPRKAIHTVRTWYQWRRLGRHVRDDERPKPAKIKGKSTAQQDSDSDGGEETTADGQPSTASQLYGIWQTDEVVVPSVDGARVPKNSYGNIELWSTAHLPKGAVHLVLPRVEKVAQELGVDYAPAVVGFEARNGKNCPKMEGIVVAAAVEEMLLDAHAHMQQTLIEKAIDKNQQIIAKRWARLVKRLLLQQRLNDEYGDV